MSDSYVIATLYMQLSKENREAIDKVITRTLDIQDENRHAELIVKFHGGKVCHGGGYMIKD